jgi:serine/threonine protein phosphatase PrpC
MGPRPSNEDHHVICCRGLGPEPTKKEEVATEKLPSGGLFDDLPDVVAGPSLPSVENTNVECLFAVFDGHGGAAAAHCCSERLPAEVREQFEASGRDTPEARHMAVEETCLALDRHLRFKLGPAGARDCGSTCVFGFAWLDDAAESDNIRLILGNLGDSRGLVLRECDDDSPDNHKLVCETSDHSPSVPAEAERIKQAGGTVSAPDKILRVDGLLGCSRALGDFYFKEDPALVPQKQKVSIVPDVYECNCGDGDVIVLACDGVFDVLTSNDVATIVSESIGMKSDPGDAAASVVKAALAAPGQQDNVTCVVALLNYPPNTANA